MPGGLLQLVVYGSQDLFLTGNPEITYFKIVYRRHTNFAIEAVPIAFNDDVGFGTTSNVILPKTGDLIHKTYVQITLPSFNYTRTVSQTDIDNLTGKLDEATLHYEYTKEFLSYNMAAYREAYKFYSSGNITYSAEMYNIITETFLPYHEENPPRDASFEQMIMDDYNNEKEEVMLHGGILLRYKNMTVSAEDAPSVSSVNYGNISLERVVDYWGGLEAKDVPKQQTMDVINFLLRNCAELDKKYFQKYLDARNALADAYETNYKFAWVDRVGHSIIDYAEIKIGGEKIDKHFGMWLDIWYELTGNRDEEDAYFKMIGNVDSLTTFDRTTKPQYTLLVPLQFWFCRFNGSALPLIALEYHDVNLEIKFRNFSECGYVEGDTSVNLDDVLQDQGKDMNANLLAEYVYLDSDERKKFAQSSHEYIIEQLQINYEENKLDPSFQLDFTFEHPCKEIIWVAQKVSYRSNPYGHTKCQWTNYSMTDSGTGNPILYSKLDFNDYERISKSSYRYFNYVQPYAAHRNTPCDGVNSYSFAISPEELQPSGTCNFSRIPRARLYLTFDPTLFENSEPINIVVFAINYNVLRVLGGLGGIAYT